MPPRLPDLNVALPRPPDLPDLNVALPRPPDLPDLNVALPQPPDLPDLNVALRQPPDLPDLNNAPPSSSSSSAESSQTSDSDEEDWLSDDDAAPDPLTLPFVNHAELGIHGTPHSAQVFALLDMLEAHPERTQQVLRVSADLLVELGPLPELCDGLEARARDEALHPVMAEAIWQLQGLLVRFEDEAVESEDEEEDNEHEELARDLQRQTMPLGWEIAQWLGQDHPDAAALSTFDDEPQAPAFARMLARLRDASQDGREGSSSTATAQRAEQVAAVIDAVAGDPDLRAQVFLIAQTALGSCLDNVLEGFSKALLAVRNHQMVADIRSGRVDAAQFDQWAGQQFRLALLESEVTRFIHRELQRQDLGPWPKRQLTREPLETLMHAKQALRNRLDLPEGTVTGVQALQLSVLRQKDVNDLEKAVMQQARDPAAYGDFRMGHTTWREGMKALYSRAFAWLQHARDDDPFFDEDIPASTDLEGQVEYAIRARAVEARWQHEEDRLLRHLAGLDAPMHPMKPEPDAA
ncbi:hypothetical protein AVHY2522_08460 [Acidovorax sp. SUPP2522]|uniref:NEL-type E3 ubiquitin ligase domain-containing protein n=1 Tax=Acidovorax sp. SUPP2522 TaxID=511900 RepID=UPI0023DE2EB3|nr:NEL-type E3 ubiquitin ligase domain-containing protein [Acidovorax sp. SUPP2522]GKT15535.1 hypothetical protein AVHY2522_08460 [Acidovorax sp. SUPP2522]